MESVIGLLTFIAIALGALAGLWLARHLPKTHLSSESRTAVSVSMAVVGTLAALVMSLLISSASASFNAKTDALHRLAVNIIRLDRALGQYGPEAQDVQGLLRSYAQTKAEELLDNDDPSSLDIRSLAQFEALTSRVLDLQPGDSHQRQAQAQALKVLDSIADAQWLLVEEANTSLPTSFVILLIFWLALLFGSFGLFAPSNATVIIVLLLCALAISGGVFMVLELETATKGLVRISTDPILNAIHEITVAR
ncbi:hypothetical protein [Microvirga sp. TS319]|uniref:bestrophin-like domain n=1 Tax=Microvirga sp. TS319 TaxID=3241165 RepID=UPI00351A4E57